MSQVKQAEEKAGKQWLPVLGFLMLVALAVLSYFLAPAAIDLAEDLIPRFSSNIMPFNQLRLAFAALVFVILAGVGGMIVAFAMPKKRSQVSEKALMKEREAAYKAKVAAKKRQRRVNRETRNQR
jgi:hypothetical protein